MGERVQHVNIGVFACFQCLVCRWEVTLYRNSPESVKSGDACQECGTPYVVTWHDPVEQSIVERNEKEQ